MPWWESSKPVGIPIGDLNDIELILGLRGYGKSTYCVDRSLALAAQTGGYQLCHSLGARLPRVLPDGREVDIRYYRSIESLDRGLQRYPTAIHTLVGGEADTIIRYARKLSREIRRKAWYRDRGWWRAMLKPWNDTVDMTGIIARPVIVTADESVAMQMNLGKTSSKNPETREFKEAIYGARHENIAYLFQIQDPNAIGPALQTQASRYIVFHLEHQWAINSVMAMGATESDIDEIRTLQVGEFVEFGPGVEKPQVSSPPPASAENSSGKTVA